MQAVRSILVVLDPEHTHSPALKRAKLIAGVTGAHLHLLMCDTTKDHDADLCFLKNELHDAGYSCSIEQTWSKNLHDTIIMVQQAEGCDLVIKQHRPDNPLKKALLTPTDWKLLRQCPSQVLMVKTEALWAGGVVLAAVDVGNTDGDHRHLHASIIGYGYEIANLAKGQLHVVAAHPSPTFTTSDPVFQSTETIEEHYREQCNTFQAEFGIDEEHLHIAEGPADVVIPFTAHKLGAAVTVIGTVARHGLPAVLVGNTAEAVLDTLESDVLVLKTQEIIDHLVALSKI